MNRHIIIVSLLCLLLGVTILVSFQEIHSADIFWHMAIGRDLANGVFPKIDSYSFSHAGRPVLATSWLFDLGAYLFIGTGEPDLTQMAFRMQVFKAVFLLTAVCSFFKKFSGTGEKVLFSVLMVILTCCIQVRTALRPELVSYPLLAAFLVLFYKFIRQPNWKPLLVMALLQLLWTNLHQGSSIFGYIIMCGAYGQFFLDRLIKKETDKKVTVCFLALGAISMAIGFLSPNIQHVLVRYMMFSSDWSTLIAEYAPIPYWYPTYFGLFCLIFAIHCLYLKEFGKMLILFILSYGLFQTHRIFPYVAFILISFLLHSFEGSFSKQHAMLRNLKTVYVLLLFLGVFTVIPQIAAEQRSIRVGMSRDMYPIDVVEFVKENEIKGNVFNLLQPSGFLIYFSHANLKVLLDGRTNILYPFAFISKAIKASQNADELSAFLSEYPADFVIAENRIISRPLFRTALETGAFQIHFMGRNYCLLKKKNGNFPKLTAVFRNPCTSWRGSKYQALEEELNRLKRVNPESPALLAFQFLERLSISSNPTDLIQRASNDRLIYFNEVFAYFLVSQADCFGVSKATLRVIQNYSVNSSYTVILGIRALLLERHFLKVKSLVESYLSTKNPNFSISKTQARELQKMGELAAYLESHPNAPFPNWVKGPNPILKPSGKKGEPSQTE